MKIFKNSIFLIIIIIITLKLKKIQLILFKKAFQFK